MSRVKREETISALIIGSSIPSVANGVCVQEFGFFKGCRKSRVTANMRRLYEIMHMARLLDSAIAFKVVHHGGERPQSMGDGLHSLAALASNVTGIANTQQLKNFASGKHPASVTKARNQYLHNAGTFPANDREVDQYLSRCEVCLSVVLV